MEPIQQKQEPTNAPGIKKTQSEKLDLILTKLDTVEKKEGTKKNNKGWKMPLKWKRILNRSSKQSSTEKVLCFFINNKGQLEDPVLLPIYNGNTIVYKYTIHEVDPRDILTFTHKRKHYKVLIYRLMDRKAISNRDYDKVKERGDGTLDDEVFIKAMLTAKASQIAKQQIGKGALIIGALAIAGLVIWIFSKG